jgi:hypothetical protein
MPEPGGPTTQSGIRFQNEAAALRLGRLLDPRLRPPAETVTAVRVEALDQVDDIVVTFDDGHREYLQVNESQEPRGDSWEKLLPDPVAEKWRKQCPPNCPVEAF